MYALTLENKSQSGNSLQFHESCFPNSNFQSIYYISFPQTYIANYDPSEDEYARKNGHGMMNGAALENNNQPVTSQPTRMQRNISINR